eukprot:scaffold5721_cov50-Phaeocystis_antarctica.AAC.5
MIVAIVARPEPATKLITPGGRALAKAVAVRQLGVRGTLANAVAVRQCTRPPMAGSLSTAVLPMSSEGMSMAYLARG